MGSDFKGRRRGHLNGFQHALERGVREEGQQPWLMWLARTGTEKYFLPTIVSHHSQHCQPSSLELRGKRGHMEGAERQGQHLGRVLTITKTDPQHVRPTECQTQWERDNDAVEECFWYISRRHGLSPNSTLDQLCDWGNH